MSSKFFFVGMFKVVEASEAVILRVDIEPEVRRGFYTMTDRTGTKHKFHLELDDSGAETFEQLAMYALVAYLANIVSNGWDGECHCVFPAMGLEPDDFDTVIKRFKFAYLPTPTISEGLALQ